MSKRDRSDHPQGEEIAYTTIVEKFKDDTDTLASLYLQRTELNRKFRDLAVVYRAKIVALDNQLVAAGKTQQATFATLVAANSKQALTQKSFAEDVAIKAVKRN
jgi:hypothetical protein